MRKYAFLEEKIDEICKVMIYGSPDETYVFLYNTLQDTGCFADMCFEVLEEAEEYCEKLGINNEDWLFIDEPLDRCQDDIINCK
ncbi:hypothetical protein ACQKOF_14095 [Lysinibacillus sp. NPDC093190]|uniref:hypothetical protein n=1 Tax=Lysinibacillus sp. NPDC093190 TaxID=3390575 RepID=UPI003CFD9611